jgi:hypothetical protein
MKRFISFSFPGVCCYIFLLTGCATTSMKIMENKVPNRPFSKILTIYLDEACDIVPFDSTTYYICIKSSFVNPGKTPVRSKVEKLVAEDLATSKTVMVGSSDVFDMSTNSYSDFKTQIKNRNIDAILVINFRNYNHSSEYGNNILPHFGPSGYGNVDYKKVTHNEGFDCFLFNAKTIGSSPTLTETAPPNQNDIPPASKTNGAITSKTNAPIYSLNDRSNMTITDSSVVWNAQVEVKGKSYSGKNGLTREMVHKITKTLEESGFIYH